MKYISYEQLTKGMEVSGNKPNHVYFHGRVKKVTTDSVILEPLIYGMPFSVPIESTFTVDSTKDDYYEQGKALYHALLNKVPQYSIGEHEWDNSWINTSDIFEMAKSCAENHFTVIGICYDLPWTKELFETGIVAETFDGERFWCHCYTKGLNDLLTECEKEFK